MKLAEALRIAKSPTPSYPDRFRVALACGFEPLHFATFLKVYLKKCLPERDVSIDAGLFGDLVGNVERLDGAASEAVLVVVEWSDLDARLGVRQLGEWSVAAEMEIVESAKAVLCRLERAFKRISAESRVVCSVPTLRMAPFAHSPSWQASPAELQLRQEVARFAMTLNASNVGLLNPSEIDRRSAPESRHDIKSEIMSGFPYQISHADVLAELAAWMLVPPVPKKGLITDLDETVWNGILGEVGVGGVHWDLDHKSQIHGLYQQLLRSLAESGVLVGVASKNDPALVQKALARPDLIICTGHLFPVEANWGRKSESVRRILKAWNVGADAVVFVDDSPMELADVKATFPQIECIQFTPSDPKAAHALLYELRSLFGKSCVLKEDVIRTQSLRRSWEAREIEDEVAPTTDEFLQMAGAIATIIRKKHPLDPRALELVNKTNQFNLNGRRFQEIDWNRYVAHPETFYMLASYRDKFGPLGKIAVLGGQRRNGHFIVDLWAMSCRAFSRRIEHACLKYLFDKLDASEIYFEFRFTERNRPAQDFLRYYLDSLEDSPVVLSRAAFERKAPKLFYRLEEIDNG